MKKRLFGILLVLTMVLSCLPGTVMAQTETKLTMYYDDHMDVSGRGAVIVDAGTPTSYQVGYGIEANTKDTAVLTLDGDTLIATGAGTAQVKLDGETYDVTVTAAPISLFLLIGQSNMEGAEGKAPQSVVCPDGQVYSTYVPGTTLKATNAANYVPSALTGAGRDLNVNGTTTGISARPVYALNEAGAGKIGMDGGFGYQWAQSTGEKVWLVNAAHGGSEIDTWQQGKANFNEAVALFSGCQETMKQEIAAGHYTLSHMGYFWNQGCGDDKSTGEWYTKKFLAMHEALKTALSADMDSDPTTPDRTLEFAFLMATLAGGEGRTGYRGGGHETPDFGFYSTYEELEMRGHRVAHRWMASNPELPDIYMISNLGEKMLTMPDGTDGVAEYFARQYPNGKVDYPVQERQQAEWYQPTTALEFKDTVHYNQIGYNEIGRDAARNAAIVLGYQPDTKEETKVTFTDWTGYQPIDEIQSYVTGHANTLVAPMVEPCYRAKQITYQVSDGLNYNYFDLTADTYETTGTLTAVGAEGEQVCVVTKTPKSYRWDMESGTALVSTGSDTNLVDYRQGKHTNNVFSNAIYRFETPVVLEHDENWALEFKMTGPWGSAVKLLSEDGEKNTKNSFAVMANGTANQLAIGYHDGSAYQRWGVALADHGISLADTHTYRLLNRVNEDGSNTIVLFVDGEEIAPMTTHFNTGETSTALSGYDFALNHLGATNNTLNNGTFIYIAAEESGASEKTHFHDFDQWEILSAPTSDTLGAKKGQCTVCGEYVTCDLHGVWQMLKLNARIQQLPETIYAQTNLADVLPDVLGHYKDGIIWSESMRSVTFAVNPGEKIYASSFGAAGTNGSADTDGSYVTFWTTYGIGKVMTPSQTYAEFSKNGYITTPDDAVLVNVTLWDISDTGNEKFIVQLPDRPSGYIPQDGDVFFIPDRVLAGCAEDGYVIATQNEDLTVGEVVPVVVPAGTAGAANTYGHSRAHFWEMKDGKLNHVTGIWYSGTKFVYSYHETITALTDTTLSTTHAPGHVGSGASNCGWEFQEACGNSSAKTRYYEGPNQLTISDDLTIIDLTGHNAKTLADVKMLTDAGRAVINVYAPDGTCSTKYNTGNATGTASVVVVSDPMVNYVPPEGELFMSGDVFFIPNAVTGGKPVEAYVVASLSKKVGSKVTITIPAGTTGANGKYSGRFWEVANGGIQVIHNVTLDPSKNSAPGANRYGYHDRINSGSTGNVIRLQDGLQHRAGAGKTNGCCLGFSESCGVSSYAKTRAAYEVGPYLTFDENTSVILDLRAEALADPSKVIKTLDALKAEVGSASNKGGEEGDSLINTYAADGVYTSATNYTTVAGTVTAIVVIDGSSTQPEEPETPETPVEYTVTVGAVENGTVTVNPATGTEGTTVTVTATPAEGYELESILVDGAAIAGNTFTISANHTVTATFKKATTLEVFFVPGAVEGGEPVEAYVVDSNARAFGSKITLTIPKGTAGADGKYSGRFWELEDGAFNVIHGVTVSTSPGANRYGYHDRINSGSTGNVIRLQDGLQHRGGSSSSNGCCLGFSESCGVSAWVSARASCEVGPYLTFDENTSVILDLRAEALADPTKAIKTLDALKAEVSSAENKGGAEGDTLINTYAADGIYTPKTTKADPENGVIGYNTVAGTVTAIVVIDGSLTPEVPETPEKYSITVGAVENGTVTVDKTEAEAGETITITATPAEGYRLMGIKVDGTAITGNTFTVTGAHEVTAEFAKLLNFASTSANVGDVLDLNFRVTVADVDFEGGYAILTGPQGEQRVDRADWQKSGTRYNIPYKGMFATMMADEVTAVVYDDNGNQMIAAQSDSIRGYTMRALNTYGSNPNYAKLCVLLVDMLVYGATAQEKFSHNQADPADSLLSDAQRALATVEAKPYQSIQEKSHTGNSASATLGSRIELNFTFLKSDVPGAASAKFTFDHAQSTLGAAEVTVPIGQFVDSGTKWKVVLNALVAADGRQPVRCEILDADGNVIAWSVDTVAGYVARLIGSNANYKWVESMVIFCDSAYGYFVQ